MAKQIKPGMLRFAKALGAMKNGRPDWYLVAEELAAVAAPELLKGEPVASRPAGRPKSKKPDDESDEVLAIEIDYLKWTKKFASLKKACEYLSESGFYERQYVTNDVARDSAGEPIRGPDGKFLVIKHTKTIKFRNPWKAIPAETLKRRYQAWLKLEKLRRAEMSITIL
jgi:hypothetical protein